MLWFSRRKEKSQFYIFFENIFGYSPSNAELYHIALTHRSLSSVHLGHKVNNERLEYLGDAVLSAVVADFLYKKYPMQGEGFLTELRSKIVSRKSLNALATKIGLTDLVEYQKDAHGIFKSIGGDALEALVGAMYLDKGFKFTQKVIVERLLRTQLDVEQISQTDWNYKSKLIDWCQKRHVKVSFELVNTTVKGREKRRLYECEVIMDGKPCMTGVDYTIKGAEQIAAERTYKSMCVECESDQEQCQKEES